ncbi:MAG: hypothetical protein JO290_02965 [Sphingomonadaceae bacterium]|nr:hypothetical protein [Sphingomonadaceae bacterium]
MDAEIATLEADELRARIRRTRREAQKLAAETRKLLAETEKYRGERRFQPWSIVFQGVLAGTAVVGAAIAIAKLFAA